MTFETNTRAAAKIILHSPEGIVLTSGVSGRRNLPGGGIHASENAQDALHRELDEELGLSPKELWSLQWQGVATGPVSSRTGRDFTAVWDVFTAMTNRSTESLAGDVDIEVVSPYELFRHPAVTDMAKQAVWLYATR